MKRLHVTQVYHPAFRGESTPDVDKHQYRVDKVIDSISPAVGENLSKQEVQNYCESESWLVTIS